VDSQKSRPVEAMDLDARLGYWKAEFDGGGISVSGCRNVCPCVFVNECSLEEDQCGDTRDPPVNPTFHLARAIHMWAVALIVGLV